MKTSIFTNTGGYSAMISMIVIIAVCLTIALGVNTSGITEMRSSLLYSQSSEAFYFADSCAEEAFIRFKNDASYVGSTLVQGDLSCNITVTDQGSNNYIIDATADYNDQYYRQIQIDINLVQDSTARNIQINSWKEL